jgi:hypothetical protein
MNDRRSAEQLRDRARDAVPALSQLLADCQSHCTGADFERIRKGVGLAIGQVQTHILDPIYGRYPELDEAAKP